MNSMLPAAWATVYRHQREQLLQAFPELWADRQALDDTMEGISRAPDIIAGFIRDARQDEAYSAALATMIREMSERKTRLEIRAERHRLAAQQLMQACDLRKLEQPDFTASIRAVPGKVEIDDEALLPDNLCKLIRQPNKVAIKEALAVGTVAGAHLTNGSETLTVKTK